MGIHATKLEQDRDWYTITYPADEVQGDSINAVFENEGDASVYAGINDGEFLVSLPTGTSVTDNVTITGSEGGEVTGEVTFE